MTAHGVMGIAAGILSLAAYPIYITEILRGITKPSLVTWWILALSNVLLAASYFASGARDTIWIPVSYSAGFLTVAVLSLKYGEGGWTTLDKLCLSGAISSVLAWYFLNSSQIALLCIVLVEFFGLIPTISKAYRRPLSESRAAWIIATVGGLLNVCAIETWTLAVAAYPFYVLVTNGAVAYLTSSPRRGEAA
jgi:hypothetical protein